MLMEQWPDNETLETTISQLIRWVYPRLTDRGEVQVFKVCPFIILISSRPVVMLPFVSIILLIWIVFLFLLVTSTSESSVLLLFPKNHFFSLILLLFFFLACFYFIDIILKFGYFLTSISPGHYFLFLFQSFGKIKFQISGILR